MILEGSVSGVSRGFGRALLLEPDKFSQDPDEISENWVFFHNY